MYLFNLFWHSREFNSVCQTAVENVKEGIDFSCLTATIFFFFTAFLAEKDLSRGLFIPRHSNYVMNKILKQKNSIFFHCLEIEISFFCTMDLCEGKRTFTMNDVDYTSQQ